MKTKGFTLLEGVILVFCLILLIGIAIPAMRRAKINSNEGRAIGTLRTLSTSQAQYQS